MSLITCPDCGTEVSRSAKACPNCGATAKAIAKGQKANKQIGTKGKIAIGAATAAFVLVAGASVGLRSPPSAVDTKENALFKQRSAAAVTDAVSLKQSLRDPDSLVFEQILANDDGSVVCISYRSRNGFGGMNRDHAVFAGDTGASSAAVWRKHCGHADLNVMTDNTVRLVQLLRH